MPGDLPSRDLPSRDLPSRADRTRAALVAAARALFAAEGFADVSVARVVAEAGVTKGALYHHFANKAELFVAVLEDVEGELQARSRAATRGATTMAARLTRGFDAYLDSVLDPGIGRIALIDGPAAVGPQRYQEIVRRFAHDDVVFVLGTGMPHVHPDVVEVLAAMTLGALTSAALTIAAATAPERARVLAGRSMKLFIDGLVGNASATER